LHIDGQVGDLPSAKDCASIRRHHGGDILLLGHSDRDIHSTGEPEDVAKVEGVEQSTVVVAVDAGKTRQG
jgi:hypothetical protein